MTRQEPVSVVVAVLLVSGWAAGAAQHAPARSGEGGAGPDECLEQLAEAPRSEAPYRCFYERRGERSDAANVVERLEALGARHPTLGWPLFYLGLARWNQPQVAEGWLEQAAHRFATAGDARGELLSRGNRANLLFLLGRIEEAGQEATLAARIGEEANDEELFARGKIYLARHLLRTGSALERAFELLHTVAGRLTEKHPPSLAHHCLVNLGNVALELGRLQQSREAYERLLTLSRRTRDRAMESEALYGLTRLALEKLVEVPSLDHRTAAMELARRTLESSRAGNHRSMEAMANWVLGVLSPTGGQDFLERCAELAPNPRETAHCMNALARKLTDRDPVAARELVDRALELAEAAGDPWSQAFAWREKMRVSWAVEPVNRAIEDSWAALETVERLRDLQPGGSNVQAGLFSTWTDDYHWFAGRLLEEARETGRRELLDEAFAVSERLRARALLDWLRAADPESAAPAPREFATVADVQAALHPGEALLAFQVAPWEDLAGAFGGGSWVLAVTRRTVQAHPLPGRPELRRAVDLYTGLFEGRDGTEAAPSAHLYDRLLGPVLTGLPEGVERLVILPDDALHRLPFGALRPAVDAPPLAVSHRLSVAPSATLWTAWRPMEGRPSGAGAGPALDGSEPRTRSALVLAAPELGALDRAAPGVGAPAPPGPTLEQSGGDAPAANASGGLRLRNAAAGLPPLRYALREGRTVVSALESAGLEDADLATGAAASEALLRRADLARFGLFHLATHAVTDDSESGNSAVLLAPGDGEDGLLRPAEIVSLDLDDSLVVLSSCRSAAGDVLRGEGVMSLARAFFQAGARTVIASLWPLRDDEAAALFEGFYRHLVRGEPTAQALRAAQRDRIAAGAPAHAWAGVVVLGDGELRPVLGLSSPGPVEGVPVLRVVVAAAGSVLALLLVTFRRRLVEMILAMRSLIRR